jgi:hypothetical protein
MHTPFILKVCEKDNDKKKQILKDFGGTWLANGIMGVPHYSGESNFTYEQLARALSEDVGEYISAINVYSRLTDFNDTFLAPTITARGWLDRLITLSIINGDKNKSEIKFIASRICGDRAERAIKIKLQFCNFSKFDKKVWPSLVKSIEFAIVCALKDRRLFGLNLTQMVRSIRTLILNGEITETTLMQSAIAIDDKFVIAAIKLASRGFKSKRFNPRPLIIGEDVKWWYDSAATLQEVRDCRVVGKVVKMDHSDKVYISSAIGNSKQCYGYRNKFEVWPVNR